MKFIWYNPDLDAYQKGSIEEFNKLSGTSVNCDRFDILYEFTDSSDKLIDKILGSLNIVRRQKVATN